VWNTSAFMLVRTILICRSFSLSDIFALLGGRGVIDGIEKNLKLTPHHVEASRYALYTYGNTSSSSIWYEMDYIRNKMGLKRGERVLQVAFGSGFKCNSAVWLCLHNNPRPADEPASETPVDSKDKKEKKDE
jgi:predicted naringenin-chalcone synthase